MKHYKEIFIYSSEFPPGPGGIGNHAFNLANHFSKNDYKVTVLAPIRENFTQINEKTEKKVSFKFIGIIRKKSKIVHLIKTIINLLKIDLSSRPLIIATGTIPLIITGLLPKFKNINKIGIIHGHETLMGSAFIKFFVSKCLYKYEKLIAVSRFSRDRVLNDYPSLQIELINNGADFSKFKKINATGNKDFKEINIITVGTLSKKAS